ncbi:hypothetical protein T484DRAFT_1811127 [Baffinella frigidus]|nr:hypothetical protein T484DRAFT_1811127 [Cryptophyta sp. CCMP2293]
MGLTPPKLQVARTCNALCSETRWMVSGTPLYTSIDDLNGELAFLGVFPFCLDDKEDGFWLARISDCFSSREPVALDRLSTLLRAVMIRHSKSQTYRQDPGDTRAPQSILDLPAASSKRVGVPLSKSEAYIYKWLEVQAVADLEDDSDSDEEEAGAALGGRGLALGAKAAFWEGFLRQCCIAPSLINGGGGCAGQIKELGRKMRTNQLLAMENHGEPTRIKELDREMRSNALRAMIKELDCKMRTNQLRAMVAVENLPGGARSEQEPPDPTP